MIRFEILRKIRVYFSKVCCFFLKQNFFSYGKKSTVIFPFKIIGAKKIKIGKGVFIGENSWVEVLNVSNKNPALDIGNNTYIGRFCHIMSGESIVIKNDVLIADKVYITDHTHTFGDVTKPYKKQGIKLIKKICIGEGAWLGENVSVIGACIGKQSIVGANSVVTKDIPDYCIAVGSPAKVIKRFNFEESQWVKTNC